MNECHLLPDQHLWHLLPLGQEHGGGVGYDEHLLEPFATLTSNPSVERDCEKLVAHHFYVDGLLQWVGNSPLGNLGQMTAMADQLSMEHEPPTFVIYCRQSLHGLNFNQSGVTATRLFPS